MAKHVATKDPAGIKGSVNPDSPNFLSLKWKITLLTSLILLGVVVFFCAISYFNLVEQFADQGEDQHQLYAKEMQGLIDQNSQKLHQLGRTIPLLENMDTALLTSNKPGIVHAFDQHWALLQLHNGIEVARFYNTSNELLASWGDAAPNEIVAMQNWVSEVNQQELPLSPLNCDANCVQYAVEPLLVAGDSAGVVVLGTSLVDAAVGYKRISDTDIGLLIEQSDLVPAGSPAAQISNWNARVTALTNRDKNIAILTKVSQEYPDLSKLSTGVQFYQDEHYYQVRLLPLQGFGPLDKPRLVAISDITSAVSTIRKSTLQNLGAGLLGLILSEILLFVILSRPLSRLRHIVFTLPLLAQGRFEDFRLSLARFGHKQWLKDEIDMLDDTGIALSHQLEELEQQVTDRTKILARQMDELGQERDFIKNLLNTAQVIVLTQSASGEILTLNNYAETVIQYTEQDLQGKSFIELLSTADDTQNLPALLGEIQHAQRDQLRHEAATLCKDGSVRHIIWLHSRLTQRSADDPAVLSVGLDITEHKHVEGRLAWLADHDPLTDLFNRRRFQEELERLLGLATRYQYTGALLFFDLDQFKYINDTSGHQAGDTLLKMVAQILLRIIRTTDVVARLGGDEFALILPQATPEGAIVVAEKILASLDEANLTVNGRVHKASASIGIALFPEHGKNVQELLAIADLAMYQAKAAGRNGWHVFSAQDLSRERMQKLVYWKEKIEHSLVHDRFVLYFQPIMDVRSKAIYHYEVLLRMLEEDGTVIAPATFIAAAEHTGLIHAIDHMVLRKAIAQAAELSQQGRNICFSINLSGLAFNDPQLLSVLAETLAYYGANPKSFIFEITETAALADIVAARKLMESIKALGCSFALDDFGVGFSSFYYLRQLPVDYVKIDGSFIQHLAENPDDQILVKALCDVAKGFGKKTTAEFVENVATLSLLEKMQVDYAQGYFIGRPLPAEESFVYSLPQMVS
ncbi:MAG: EAL domain-containing protein [Gammaproteobacteria bacterium]